MFDLQTRGSHPRGACQAERLTPDQVERYALAGEDALKGILARLSPEEGAAFWSAVRTCYNRPYNDAAPVAEGIPAPEVIAAVRAEAVRAPLPA